MTKIEEDKQKLSPRWPGLWQNCGGNFHVISTLAKLRWPPADLGYSPLSFLYFDQGFAYKFIESKA